MTQILLNTKMMYPRVLLLVLLVSLKVPVLAQTLPALIPFNRAGLWGYADTAGNIRIPPRWQSAQFFIDGRAVVVVPAGSGQRAPFALIDTQGRYIIAPETGWVGAWGSSWGTTDLNAYDSAGRQGLVDFDGHISIPREWTGGLRMQGVLADSFRIVYRDGLAGIVDRQGRIAEPVKWGGIESSDVLATIRAFQMVDPDNTNGYNNVGVADLNGRLLIPPRYHSVRLKTSKAGKLFFEVGRMASNEKASGYGGDVYGSQKFFDYPACRQIPNPGEERLVTADRGTPLPGGYFDMGRRLTDSSGKIIVPCCRFLRLSGDTLVLRDTSRAGRDSVALRVEYLDIHSRRKLAPTRKQIVYIDEEREKYFREDRFSYREASYRNQPPPMTIMVRDYGGVEKFYKDSFLFHIVKPADGQLRYWIVTGINSRSRWGNSKMAVVDTGFHYLMLPRADREILAYNAGQQLATIRRYNPATKYYEQWLVTPDFNERELFHLRRGEILAGYRWQGRVYALIHVQDECDASPAGARYYVTDSSGIPLPAFTPYRFSDPLAARDNISTSPSGVIRVVDSAGRTGLLRPDGTPAFPALNFKYRMLELSVNGWYLASGGPIPGMKLLDTAGRSILPDSMNVQRIAETSPRTQRFYGQAYTAEHISGLYDLSVLDSRNNACFMYIDCHGRLYFSN